MSVTSTDTPESGRLRYRSGPGRWALAAVILGSGAAFFESSVVSVALPSIGRDLGLSLGGLQWVMNAYLLALSALMITGGSLGDIYGRRRIFVGGLAGFGIASAFCALAPTGEILILARVLQGVAAALVVPSSLAIIQASFAEADRGAAIGLWSGFSGVSTLFGPALGGWLVDATTWRLVFGVVLLFAGLAAWTALRHLPESRSEREAGSHPDWTGSILVSLGLGAVTYALIEAPGERLMSLRVLLPVLTGTALLAAFLLVERRVSNPMLPLGVFRSRQFSGANAATLCNYMAIGSLFFFLSLQLQDVLGYSALEAGAATIPPTVIMLLFSPLAGRIGQRLGPRGPMTVGPIVMGAGVAMVAGLSKGGDYLTDVFPGMIVFGIGMTIMVAPLTTAVLAALPNRQAGIASAVNNAVARFAQLMASAALPAAAGLSAGVAVASDTFSAGFHRAMLITAGIAVLGGLVSFITIRGDRVAATEPVAKP
ncbi:MAG: MFS transporter [Solirubrobacterales bacterium]|nr:MFS transporter [Solirubrobacterales bacterium]